ncbi:hypothetical protein [Streptosporangium pseudovulgare]|uniref:Polysaccharide deacetylase n=1 Tax=Streptosporangium pseudovulgare TaxID=35765 RepID=A0ABQ2RCC6_9ACTN|nr:hypothetical protein [Streptosporangium pseudovulgare]GGQ19902.1 hypothetical protein GCM10010140_57850 [Streptosporangium pseudovulgare]
MSEFATARTYNQNHVPRPYAPGRRRMSIYVAWSYPAEAGRNTAELDNRFSTMTEVRRVQWPAYEDPQWSDPLRFQQGIAGGLELFFWGWLPFQQFVREATGYPVPVYQRVDQAGFHTPLDERVLADTDTLFVWGLDHMITGQEATAAEIEAVRAFLTREGTCLALGPHHDVGATDDLAMRDVEYHHHGDALVPRQQRFGRYTRSLMAGLGLPVENRYGLRPAVMGKGQNVPLSIARDLDAKGWLEGVSHFNFHMHLPHYAVTTDDPEAVQVLGRQPIDLTRPPHPFVEAGNTEFNMFLWLPPRGDRAGDVIFADSTIFSSLFGIDDSLRAFWNNLLRAR